MQSIKKEINSAVSNQNLFTLSTICPLLNGGFPHDLKNVHIFIYVYRQIMFSFAHELIEGGLPM